MFMVNLQSQLVGFLYRFIQPFLGYNLENLGFSQLEKVCDMIAINMTQNFLTAINKKLEKSDIATSLPFSKFALFKIRLFQNSPFSKFAFFNIRLFKIRLFQNSPFSKFAFFKIHFFQNSPLSKFALFTICSFQNLYQ